MGLARRWGGCTGWAILSRGWSSWAGFAAVALAAAARAKSASRKRTVSKYEARRTQQENAFGHDVAERAAAAGRVPSDAASLGEAQYLREQTANARAPWGWH